MRRRKFIQTVAGATAGMILLPSAAFAKKRVEKLTILHTNDTHSRIDPFPADDARYAGLGGVSRRKSLIDQVRTDEEHVLLLDAGDIFQGTPYFNLYGGELEFKLMSAMQYDAATMGNHDFDGGVDGFVKALPNASFPFLCANYDFSDTALNGLTQERKVFTKGSLRIGVFGVGVELDGLVAKKMYGETRYLDPVAVAQKQADILKNDEKCDLVICLSHLGYKPKLNQMCDTVLAESTTNINLIIGGHTHTFMDKPEEFKNKEGKKVLINQVGWSGLVLGRVDFYFSKSDDGDEWAIHHRSSNSVIGSYETA